MKQRIRKSTKELRAILERMASEGRNIVLSEVKVLYAPEVTDEYIYGWITHWNARTGFRYRKLWDRSEWVLVQSSILEKVAEANEKFKASEQYPYIVAYDPVTGALKAVQQVDPRTQVQPRNMMFTCKDAADYAIATAPALFLNFYGVK